MEQYLSARTDRHQAYEMKVAWVIPSHHEVMFLEKDGTTGRQELKLGRMV